MNFQAGQKVGDYEIVGLLGRGGMGEVFRVRNVLSGRVEAMKIVLPDSQANPEIAERFLREIRVHASLEHPHIAQLRTALRVENHVVMIMELVEGVSLDECLRQGVVDVRDGVRYTLQVLSALEYAHARAVIHRDIKPANIIVTPDGTVKLTDFGIARAPGDPTFTRAGLALGSLYYMSPEQANAEPLDGRSDLYSLGVTLYEIVTGRRPIDGDSDYAILKAHATATPAAPIDWNPNLPPALNAAILKALAKHPGDRFQTAAEFRDALRDTGVVDRSTTAVPVHGMPYADAARLAAVESVLVAVLGPIAKHLVARTAQRASSLEDLCRRLAEQIPDAAERKAFLRAVGQTSGPSDRPTSQPVAPTPSPVWEPGFLESAKQALAPHLGPIAGVVVNRAAKGARNKQELLQNLVTEIPSERDRKAFLERVGG